jgi:hypothetical protein
VARASQSYHLRVFLLLLCIAGSGIVIVSRLVIMALNHCAEGPVFDLVRLSEHWSTRIRNNIMEI